MTKLKWILICGFILSMPLGMHAKNPKCPRGQGWDGGNRVCGCFNGLLKDQSGLRCITQCPAGEAPSGADRQCKLVKCPDGYVQKGNQCIKDTVASPPANSGMIAEGSQCGTVLMNGKWQSGVRCPAGLACENPTGRTGVCKKPAPPAAAVGANRTESKENGLCGKVRAANGAMDNVTCTGGMTCTPSTNATYAAQGLGSCKKPAAAAPVAAGGTEGVGARCGTWYSGGDVTKNCAAGLTCMQASLTAPVQAGKSGTCARRCSDPNGVNGCQGGWSAQP